MSSSTTQTRRAHVPRKLTRRLATASVVAALLLPSTVRAEPPQMKEDSVVPRLSIAARDGSMALAVGGFLQARYSLTAPTAEPIRADITLPRARFYAFGQMAHGRVRYRIGLGNPPGSTELTFLDVYSEVKVLPEVRIRAGRFKIPVVREWVEAARLLASVERSTATQAVLPGRELGLLVSGDPLDSAIEYAFGAFGGRGDRPTAATDRAPGFSARVLWNVMKRSIEGEADFDDSAPALSVGGSVFTTVESDRAEVRTPLRIAGAEVAFRAHGLDVAMELMERRDSAASFTRGGYLRADYFIRSVKSTLGARIVRLQASDPTIPTTELSADAGYFPFGHDLKVVTEVSLARRSRSATNPWEPALTLQLQTGF